MARLSRQHTYIEDMKGMMEELSDDDMFAPEEPKLKKRNTITKLSNDQDLFADLVPQKQR